MSAKVMVFTRGFEVKRNYIYRIEHVLLQGYLLNSNSKTDDLTETILNFIYEKKPESIKQLVIMLKESLDFEEKVILNSVLKLQAEGAIKLEDQSLQSLGNTPYLETGDALWYGATIAAAVLSAVLIFTIPDNFYPWIYLRNVSGIIIVLFLPGYALINALFPVEKPNKTSTGNIDAIERVALSIVLSIAIVAIVGLLLNFSPWGLDLHAVILSLLTFTLVFATVAAARKYNTKKEAQNTENVANTKF
jgi:hypothetical protein